MKIALISDIHGNLPALEAVLCDIEKHNIGKIICLGDIIGKGPDSRSCFEICISKCDINLIGNWEAFIFGNYLSSLKGRTIGSSTKWYINELGDENLKTASKFPHYCEFFLSGNLVRVFHAHPKTFNRYHPTSEIEKRRELFEPPDKAVQKKADIAIYADIHTVYLQELDNRILLNTGSVGNPLDITQASYVILDGNYDETTPSAFSTQFVRVPYDIERAVSIAKKSGMPHFHEYKTELQTAQYCRRS